MTHKVDGQVLEGAQVAKKRDGKKRLDDDSDEDIEPENDADALSFAEAAAKNPYMMKTIDPDQLIE